MRPGRNDPCPCGSGKKYKKCCLGKAATGPEGSLADSAAPTNTTSTTEPRFYPALTSYYTEAALTDAMRPGGSVHIHPYALIKLREDPRLSEQAPHVLKKIWRGPAVSAMSTQEIEAKLAQLGVRYHSEDFPQLTRNHTSAWDLATQWIRELPKITMWDADFVGLAACELWRRRVPERPSLEMIDDWVCEGYAYSAEHNPVAALASWWRAWEALREKLKPEMKDLGEAGDKVFPDMSQRLPNWVGDFRLEALNAAVKDPQSGETGIIFIREVLEFFQGESRDLHLVSDLAALHLTIGRDTEGEQLCQRLISEHPDFSVGYVTMADALIRRFHRGVAGRDQLERAISLLEQALAYPVKDPDAFDVPARLARARAELAGAAVE